MDSIKQNTRQTEVDARLDAIREKYGEDARRYRASIAKAERILSVRQEVLKEMIAQQQQECSQYPQVSYEGRKVWNEWQTRINAQRKAIEQAKIDLSNARVPKHQADELARLMGLKK